MATHCWPNKRQLLSGLDALKKASGRDRFSGSRQVWLELESEGGSTAPEGCDAALALLFLIALLPLIDEGFAAREHEVHHPGELVSDGGVGTGLVHAGAEAAVERAEGRVAAREAHGGHFQCLPGAVGGASGAGRQRLAATDLRGGTQAQP